MKKKKTLNWLLITIGTLSVFASIFLAMKGEHFNGYFWGGFCGLTLIGTGTIELNKKEPDESCHQEK